MGDRRPIDIDLLWGEVDEPSAKPRTGLSLRIIARAAVELADEGGLAAVSMARIADRLGFATMSLYKHVKSKDEVLLLMLDAATPVPPELDEPVEHWRAGLQRWCAAQWVMLRAHPWIVNLPITGPPVTPNQLEWTERGLRVLGGTGLSERDKVNVVLLVASYMLTAARMSADVGTAASSDSVAAYSALLGELVDARRFPALRASIDAGAYDYAPELPDAERQLGYSFGLERILDGVDSLIRHR